MERAWLWCKRRPAVAALSAAVVLATVGGTAAIIGLQAKANTDLRAANSRVEQRYELAVDAIKTFHTGVSEDFLLKQDQFKELRDRLLKSAADFYGKLGALLRDEKDRASRRALAASNFELADLTDKVGGKEDALKAHRAVLAMREALVAGPRADVVARVDVGRSLTAVARLLDETGQTNEAMATYRRAESLLEGLAASDPAARAALAASRSRLGSLLSRMGQSADALSAYRRARADQEVLAAAPGAPNDIRRALGDTVNRIGILFEETGRLAEAEVEKRKALEIRKKLADDNPGVIDFRIGLAGSHNNLGWLLFLMGKPGEAKSECHIALRIWQELAVANPAVTQFQSDLARSGRNMGILQSETGQPGEAMQSYKRAKAIWQNLADANPAVIQFQADLAASHGSIGNLQRETGQTRDALRSYEQGMVIFQKLADTNPEVISFRHDLAISHNLIGKLQSEIDQPKEAMQSFERAHAILQKLADANPTVTEFQSDLGATLNNVAMIEMGQGRWGEARSRLIDAVRYQRVALRAYPRNSMYRQLLSLDLSNLARTRLALRTPAEAAESARELVALTPGDPETLYNGSRFLARCTPLAAQPSDASRYADEALSLLKQAVSAGWNDAARTATDPDLAALRGREDFKLMMMDLSFPAEPFARAE